MRDKNTFGTEFPYEHRTGYSIYAANGKEVRRVLNNNVVEFETTPLTIPLTPGIYRIHAMTASGYGERVTVPVVIEAGRTTDVHLNRKWQPPTDAAQALVYSPAGYAIGWRAP